MPSTNAQRQTSAQVWDLGRPGPIFTAGLLTFIQQQANRTQKIITKKWTAGFTSSHNLFQVCISHLVRREGERWKHECEIVCHLLCTSSRLNPSKNTQIHKYTSTIIHKHTNTQIHKVKKSTIIHLLCTSPHLNRSLSTNDTNAPPTPFK